MRKEEILFEIKRIAKENDDKSPSKNMFEKTTGIKTYVWQKFWSRWSEVLQAAGLAPNQFLGTVYSDDNLINRLIELIRELGRLPTLVEMRIKKRNDPTFPSDLVIVKRLGKKQKLILSLLNYCRDKEEFVDIIKMLELISLTIRTDTIDDTINNEKLNYGFVYLVKGHPGEYKIGRTNLIDRRLSELGATASIEQELVHEIKTDDPVGVEAYWHKRFHDKRMKGEWFRLNTAEVNSFRKWRRIY